jgi:hypothetical protein
MDLTLQHNVSGVNYGPGHVRVHPDLGKVLAEQERNFHRVNRRLTAQGAHIIGHGNRLIRVDYGTFDQSLANASPHVIIPGA